MGKFTDIFKKFGSRTTGKKSGKIILDEFGNLVIKNEWPYQGDQEMNEFFGKHGENLITITLPYTLFYNGDPVTRMTCNKKVAESIKRVMTRVLNHYIKLTGSKTKALQMIDDLKLNRYGGCLSIRKIRGGSKKWSIHSWGCAIDWCPGLNQFRWKSNKALFAGPEYKYFWDCWEAEGWKVMGREYGYDWMHVQAAKFIRS